MIHGYHVIWGTHGFWLPNDPRGAWSDFVYAWELAWFGKAFGKSGGTVGTVLGRGTDLDTQKWSAPGSTSRELRNSQCNRQELNISQILLVHQGVLGTSNSNSG